MRNNVLKHLNVLHDLIFTVQSCEEYSTVLPSQKFGIIFNNEVMFWIRLVNVRGISNWVSEEILEWFRFAISRSVIGLVKSRYFPDQLYANQPLQFPWVYVESPLTPFDTYLCSDWLLWSLRVWLDNSQAMHSKFNDKNMKQNTRWDHFPIRHFRQFR